MLVEKLERTAKQLDRQVKWSLGQTYNMNAADMRELLNVTIKHIREQNLYIDLLKSNLQLTRERAT